MKKIFAVGAVTAAAAAAVLFAGAPAFADDEMETSGNGSVLGGNQIGVDANVPINVCGNAIAVLGIAGASCDDSGAAVIEHDHGHGHYGW